MVSGVGTRVQGLWFMFRFRVESKHSLNPNPSEFGQVGAWGLGLDFGPRGPKVEGLGWG